MKHLTSEYFFDALSTKACETRSPEAVTFELTYGCNLRCLHCYNPTHRALPGELTKEEIFSILDQLAALGVLHVHFTGGEPFVRPDALDIYEYAKHQGLILHLLSNATRITPDVADALQHIGFEAINISIYGATKLTYEQVTQIPGSYELFLRGLDCLASRKVTVIVRMPVLSENAEEVHDARRLVEGYGFKFQYCLDIIPKTNGDTSPLSHRLNPSDKVRINQVMLGFSQKPLTDPSCATNRNFIECACGQSRFAITPYGEMILCVAFPIPKYDLRKGTVKEGWEVLKQTVDRARPNEQYECPTCDVRTHCRQGRNDAWLATGDMSVCLPHYKEWASLDKQVYDRLKS